MERGLGSTGEPELAQDVADVSPRRALGDDQRGGNLRVAGPPTQQAQDLQFALRQRLHGLRSSLSLAKSLGKEASHGLERPAARASSEFRARDLRSAAEKSSRCYRLDCVVVWSIDMRSGLPLSRHGTISTSISLD